MGRKRKKQNEKLPKYVYLSKGRYTWRPYEDGKLGKEVRLCSGDATLSEIWAAYEALNLNDYNSLRWLFSKYMASLQFKNLAPKTKKELERQKNTICSAKLRGGR